MGEFDTVRFLIKKGRSVARFGDGELKILATSVSLATANSRRKCGRSCGSPIRGA
jgi:hypothetical protein